MIDFESEEFRRLSPAAQLALWRKSRESKPSPEEIRRKEEVIYQIQLERAERQEREKQRMKQQIEEENRRLGHYW